MALAPTSRLHWAGTYDQAFDYAAGTVVLQGGALYRARVLRPHGAAAPADDAASWDTLASAPAAPAGVPVLYGPYVVDYTDIPTDAATLDLWTPVAGDVLLNVFVDHDTVVQWDQGELAIGQDPSWDGTWRNELTSAAHGNIGRTGFGGLDSLAEGVNGSQRTSAGDAYGVSAAVLRGGTSVAIALSLVGGSTDPAQGHCELYALIARAIAP